MHSQLGRSILSIYNETNLIYFTDFVGFDVDSDEMTENEKLMVLFCTNSTKSEW